MSQFTAEIGGGNRVDESEQLSQAVIAAVADAEQADPLDLTPLYQAIDPDALDSLFKSVAGEGTRAVDEISFEYHGYDVTVAADGDIQLSG